MSSVDAIAAIENLTHRKFSDEQRAILMYPSGMSIAAVAGSGKTTVLTALITKRLLTGEIEDPSKILCTTFSKVGATELESRLLSLTLPLGVGRVKVCTLHSACYQILAHFGQNVQRLDDSENYALIRQAVAQAVGHRVWLEQDKLEQLESTISIMDGALMSVDELMQSGKYLLEYNRKTFEEIITTYKALKRATGKYTFDDMLIGVYEWLCVAKAEVVLQYVRDTYRYLFLDEFQDTNKVQFEIIKAILNMDPTTYPERRLVVVGDDDQNVYEWRGTDPRIMIDIRSVVDVTKMNLSTNYRCGRKIVDSAMSCVRHMGTRQDKTMQAYKDGGRVELLDPFTMQLREDYRSSLCRSSRMIADRIFAEANAGQVMPGHWCIMARTNAEMSIIANMLFRQGMIVNQTSGMKISNKPTWQALKKIIGLARPFNGNYKLQGILYQLVPYASNKVEEAINEVSNNCLCSIDYAIEYMLQTFISNVDDSDYAGFSTRDISEEVLPGREKDKGKGRAAITVRTRNKIEMVLGNFRNTFMLIELINAMRSEDSLEQLLKMWRAASENESRITTAIKEYLLFLYNSFGDAKFDQFILATEQVENNPNPAICDKRVELRTIHGSKGMEWDVVYILNDDNYSFPDFNKLFNMRENQGLSFDVLKNVVDSERRLHYVAQTRARNELYMTCNRKEASVFVEETFGYEYSAPTDTIEAARMRNAGCNDENGRIVFKACNKDYNSRDLSRNTLLV